MYLHWMEWLLTHGLLFARTDSIAVETQNSVRSHSTEQLTMARNVLQIHLTCAYKQVSYVNSLLPA
jgi:hypothetical protein